MRDTERNVIAMFKTVRTYMNAHQPLWTGFKAVEVAVAELNTQIEDINASVMRQEEPTTGITLDKAAARGELEDLIREIGDAVYAYASRIGDNTLAGQAEIKVSELDTMSEQRVDDVAMRLRTAAAEHLTPLGDYGVDQAKLDALDAARLEFQGDKSKPRAKIAEKAGETATLPAKIRTCKTLLRTQLDKLMSGFRKSQPEFYAGYQSARVIVDRRGAGGDEEPEPPPPGP